LIEQKFDHSSFQTPKKKSNFTKEFYNTSELKKVKTDGFTYYVEKNPYEVLISLKKPELKSKILAIIQHDLFSLIGLKWLNFSFSQNKPPERLLMSLTEDGLIHFHRLKRKNSNFQTKSRSKTFFTLKKTIFIF